MFLVTGGAGFIGSNVVADLDENASADIVVCDRLRDGPKWRNLQKRRIADLIPPEDIFAWLEGRKLQAVVHLGAKTDTTATDGDLVVAENFRFSLRLLDWCTQTRTRLIYASSAATYGSGAQGFSDRGELEALRRLVPLNLYGWSKHMFDLAVANRRARGEALPPQVVGLKFFNVFGPNEYHKGRMRSVVATAFEDAASGRGVSLFRSHRDDVADGDQRRDFIYVNDIAAAIRWFLGNPQVSGLYNLGTGVARSFRELVEALFAALGREPNIAYVDMPAAIRPSYQYFTQAPMEKLREAGFDHQFTPLEVAVRHYVTGFLAQADRYR